MFAFKGCSWRPIPAYPQFSYWQPDKLVEPASSRAFKWYTEPYELTMVLLLILIGCPAFKGCSWRAIPVHPRWTYWLSDKLVELASSRAFKWCAEPYEFSMVLDPLIFIECPALKGCSWREIPAHPRCTYWLSEKLVELASSRAFKWCAEPYE